MTEPMRELIVDAQTGEKIVRELTDQEIAEQKTLLDPSEEEWQIALRYERNKRLAETDYLGLPDLGGFSAEMTAYRQALRDLPANTADPANPVWPRKPE